MTKDEFLDWLDINDCDSFSYYIFENGAIQYDKPLIIDEYGKDIATDSNGCIECVFQEIEDCINMLIVESVEELPPIEKYPAATDPDSLSIVLERIGLPQIESWTPDQIMESELTDARKWSYSVQTQYWE